MDLRTYNKYELGVEIKKYFVQDMLIWALNSGILYLRNQHIAYLVTAVIVGRASLWLWNFCRFIGARLLSYHRNSWNLKLLEGCVFWSLLCPGMQQDTPNCLQEIVFVSFRFPCLYISSWFCFSLALTPFPFFSRQEFRFPTNSREQLFRNQCFLNRPNVPACPITQRSATYTIPFIHFISTSVRWLR